MREGEVRPLRLRKGTRTSEAMFAGDAWGEGGGRQEMHPPSPLTLREGGRFLAALRNDIGTREGGVRVIPTRTSRHSRAGGNPQATAIEP